MKALLLITSIAVIIGMAACQKKDDGAPPAPTTQGGTAVTPQPCNYPNAPGCTGTNGNYTYPNGQYPYSQYPNGQYPYNPYYNNGMYQGYYYQDQYYSYNYNQPYNWNYGSWYWPQQWNPSSGTCGCQSGYSPTFNPGTGVACVPYSYYSSYSVSYYNYNSFSGMAQNSPYTSTPQNYYQGQSSNCFQMGQSCDTRTNNCASDSTCQAVGGGSIFGLCVKK